MAQKTKADKPARPAGGSAHYKAASKTLAGLNKEQKEAVTHGEGPLLIVAGAGTGKTTVITRRIAYLIEQGVKPEAILALAFADKAAEEMDERVGQLLHIGYYNLQISTFHSFCERVLKEHGLEIGLPDFKILDEVSQWLLIKNNLGKFDLDYYRPLGNPTRFIKALVQHFARAKDELISPQEYLEYAEKLKLDTDSTPSPSPPSHGGEREREVANAYHVYQKLLLDSSSLDFGDLINYSLNLFEKRPQVLEHYRRRFEYILIDEFQDTNYAQYELLKLLAAPKNNITVVGDDDQSIYKFRGASISNILHFKQDYPEAKFISLTENYRTGQKILDQAYEFIKQNNPDRLEKKLAITKKLNNPRAADGTIEHLEAPDYIAEAGLVVGKILELKSSLGNPASSSGQALKVSATSEADKSARYKNVAEGFPVRRSFSVGGSPPSWNDFAILARSHETLIPFINKLEERQIPYIYFANQGLYRKSIVQDLLAYFRLLDNYHESSALYRVLNFPSLQISPSAIIELTHYARRRAISLYEALKLSAMLKNIDETSQKGIKKLLALVSTHTRLAKEKTVGQVYVQVLTDFDFSKLADEDYQTVKYLEALSRKIQNFINESPAYAKASAGRPDKSLKTFISELNFELEAGAQGELEFDPEAGPEAVKVMTVHAAKGLEYRFVFMVGLVDKRFPTIERSEPIEIPKELVKDILPEGEIHLQEERRLFYVGMTRTKQGLYLTRARDYGGKRTKKPSRFLVELGLAREESSQPTGQVKFDKVKKLEFKYPIPKHFSFSQISAFRSCPLKYKYEYVLKLPAPGAAPLSFGLTIHKTLEKFLRLIKQGQNQDLFSAQGGKGPAAKLPSINELEKFYEQSWIDDWYRDKAQKEEYLRLGQKMLKDFFEEIKKDRPQPKYLEEYFKLPIGDYRFTGKLDRADQTPRGLVIIDYKTGASRPIEKVDKEQLLIYQWAAQDFFKEEVADLQYWFLKDKLVKASFRGSQTEIGKMKDELSRTIEEILEAVKKDSFAEKDGRITHQCQYRELEM